MENTVNVKEFEMYLLLFCRSSTGQQGRTDTFKVKGRFVLMFNFVLSGL